MSFLKELKRRNVLRVALGYVAAAWLLLQVSDVILGNLDAPDWAFRGLLWLLVIGFVPALVLAWVFEFTSEGIALEKDVDRHAVTPREATRGFDRIIMVVLALAVAYFAVDKFVLSPAPVADTSIAVLPFVNMSDDPANDYFADGISEELLNLLARVPELRVISRSSAFSFKGRDIDIPTVADKLDVAHVLEGSVRKAGNEVRITAQLIEARSDTHIWSETYDRTLDDIFAIQDEIARHVVDELKVRLLGELPESDRIDPEAYRLFLQARHILNQYAGRLEQAEQLLEQALAIEPEYATALAELARVYARQRMEGSRPAEEAEDLITETLDEAMSIDADNATVQLYYGGTIQHHYNDYARAAPYFARAAELAPTDAHILRLVAFFARRVARFEEANAIGEYLIARDPVCTDCYFRLALSYRAVGNIDRAEELLRTVLTLDPEHHSVHFLLGTHHLFRGDPEAALREFELDEGLFRATGRILALHDLGRNAEFKAELAQLREQPDVLDELADIYAWTGDADAAFAALEEMLARYGELPHIILYEPLYAELHADPRWDALLEKVGKSRQQLAAIEFDVNLPATGGT